MNGTLTLSPTGDGPYVKATAHWNAWSVWRVPGGSEDQAAVAVSSDAYRIINQPSDRTIETWEFEPGDEVEGRWIDTPEGQRMVAIKLRSGVNPQVSSVTPAQRAERYSGRD
jgi:hypothetical protein